MIDLRTETEKARDERDDKICKEFASIVKAAPEASTGRIASALGEMFGMTRVGILKVLQRRGLYTPGAKRDGLDGERDGEGSEREAPE